MSCVSKNCHLIEPAENFLNLLSKPITTIIESKNSKYNLYSKWTHYFIELYESRLEFLLMGETRINGKTSNQIEYFKRKFDINYEDLKKNLEHLDNNLDLWNNIEEDLESTHIILNLDQKKNFDYNTLTYDTKTLKILEKYIKIEEDNSAIIEDTMFKLIIFVFQYLNAFEEKCIQINLWNYSLKSITFSYKYFCIGVCTVLCQYVWTGALVYNVITEFNISSDPTIILISIITTIVSLLYGINCLISYNNSRKLYTFLLRLYDDYPDLVLSKSDKKNEFYKSRNITMKKWHIVCNFWMDFLSNFILPICIPIINIFIIINSDDIVDAILNSVAVFFIIQIDEDLLTITSYENEKNTINFTRWLISVIYCKHFNVFSDIYKMEYNSWCTNLFRLSKRYSLKTRKNRIVPIDFKSINESPSKLDTEITFFENLKN